MTIEYNNTVYHDNQHLYFLTALLWAIYAVSRFPVTEEAPLTRPYGAPSPICPKPMGGEGIAKNVVVELTRNPQLNRGVRRKNRVFFLLASVALPPQGPGSLSLAGPRAQLGIPG
jgi:hypothetical protein